MKRYILIPLIMFSLCLEFKPTSAQNSCWITKTSMSVARGVMAEAVLNNTIYVIGGSLDAYTSTWVVEAYDAATDSWALKANLPQKLCGSSAGTVNDKIYVIGGSTSIFGSGHVVGSVYEYNPVSDSWMGKSNIPTPLMFATSAVVNGKIYVIGGCPFGLNSAYKSVYEYDSATDTWAQKSDMPTARFLASATAVDGKIYVFGGMPNLYGNGFSTVEVYDPSADTWNVKENMPIPRCAHSSSAVNGYIYIFSGGERMGTVNNNVLEYNPTDAIWSTKTSIPTPRVGLAACFIEGKIYVIGGMDISNIRLSKVEAYDPSIDITGVEEQNNSENTPVDYLLYQNYPNPFNPTTKLSWQLPVGSRQTLKIYDVLGRELATLVNEYKLAGKYEVEFDASNLSSGIYFYQIKAGNFIQTRKMILLK